LAFVGRYAKTPFKYVDIRLENKKQAQGKQVEEIGGVTVKKTEKEGGCIMC